MQFVAVGGEVGYPRDALDALSRFERGFDI